MIETALQQLLTSEKEARDFGFVWPNADMIIDQAVSECEEIKEAITQGQSRQRVQEEVGDLLHTAMSLCFFLEMDVLETLAKTADKFQARMDALKVLAQEAGYADFKGQPMALLNEFWQRAKRKTSNQIEHHSGKHDD